MCVCNFKLKLKSGTLTPSSAKKYHVTWIAKENLNYFNCIETECIIVYILSTIKKNLNYIENGGLHSLYCEFIIYFVEFFYLTRLVTFLRLLDLWFIKMYLVTSVACYSRKIATRKILKFFAHYLRLRWMTFTLSSLVSKITV